MDAAATIGLDPHQFAAVFPFHLIFDDMLAVQQYGASLRKLIPLLARGVPISECIAPVRPSAAWTVDDLRRGTDVLYVVRASGSNALLRGQVLQLRESPPLFAFLASPWLEKAGAINQFGLTLSDFAIHDVSLDLVQGVESMRIANDDLRRLNEVLTLHRSKLQQANAEISARNSELERIARELEDAQRIAGLGTWRYSVQADHLEWSEALGRLLSIERGVFGSTLQNWLELVHPADRARVEAALVSAGLRELDIDFRVIRGDGQKRYVHLRSRQEGSAVSPDVASGTIQDITHRRLHEKMLHSQRRQIRKLAIVASRTDNGVVITGADGRIQWANQAFRRQTGYKPAELRGQIPGRLLQVEETDPAVIAHMRSCLAQGEGFNVELLNAAADGRRYWVALDVQPVKNSQGRITRYISIQRDVTTARQQQQDLERLRAERDVILDLSPDGFLAFDPVGLPVYVNPSAARLLGVPYEDLARMNEAAVDATLSRLVAGAEEYTPADRLADDAADVLRIPSLQHALRRSVRSIRSAQGDYRGRVIYLRDISSEMALDRARAEFLATAAHELRTPMSSIHGFSELLMTRQLDEPIRREVIETIHTQSEFVVRMVNDLLDLERISKGNAAKELKVTEFLLYPLLQRLAEGVLIEGDSRRIDFKGDLRASISVVADADKLYQALLNVVSNAFRYSRSQGGPIELSVLQRGDVLRQEVGIAVRDYGIGMTQNQLGRIFDRFYRADSAKSISGTGLGMTLVKEIMDRLGGAVDVVSELGRGTCVTLWVLRGSI
jgi:PAS domain S-box-containing protein